MAKYGLLLPRTDMVEPAGRIARELGMDVVFNQSGDTERILDMAAEARRLGADILVARGRQASILRSQTDYPLVEVRLTDLEVARLLHRAKSLAPQGHRPKIGVVTIPNMIGSSIQGFDDILDIELHTYFVAGSAEMERGAEQAVADGMDVILGGDFVNAYCRRLGKRTLFFEGTEDSIRASLLHARTVGQLTDAERRNTAHLQALLDYSFNGILELDPDGVIVQGNDMACKILGLEREKLVGQPLSALMPREDAELWADALARQQELYFSVLNISGVHVVANAAPVADQDALEGMVFSFYEMNTMEQQGERALRERYRLQRYLAHGRFEDVDHVSRGMSRLVKQARTFAGTEQPILLGGEVGCGKSLFAQSIHNISLCAKGPFVTFDCSAFSADGPESALGRAALAAHSGTLYLDNLDQLSPRGQRVLCRLLREDLVHLPGEEAPTPVKVRVIASIQGRLEERLDAGALQPELFYLLAPLRLSLPPLRSRQEDLDQAIDMCLDDCVVKFKRYVVLTKEARKRLNDYSWPGNYIQLRAFLERMVLTAPSRTVNASYVMGLLQELYPVSTARSEGAQAQELPDSEGARLAEVLSRNGGNRAAAAAELGISKTTLWRRMKQYGIRDKFES